MIYKYQKSREDKQPFGKPVEISEGVYLFRQPMNFQPGHINCYLIEGVDGFTVVDTGNFNNDTRRNWEEFLASSFGRKGVKQVYLTHGHPDHSGQAQWLCQETGAPLLIAPEELDAVRRLWRGSIQNKEEVSKFFKKWGTPEEHIPSFLALLEGFRWGTTDLDVPIELIEEGQKILIGSRQWEVKSGYGHTPRNTALFCKKDGIMMTGDHILPRIYPNISIWWGASSNPLQEYLDSIVGFKDMKCPVGLPSHGPAFDDMDTRVAQINLFHAKRIKRAIACCQGEPKTAFECIDSVLGKSINSNVVSLVAGQVYAIMAYLEGQGLVEKINGDVYRFQTREGVDPEGVNLKESL